MKNEKTGILIAPCGMNCELCIAHQRDKKQCPGCHGPDDNKPKHCTACRIKHCKKLADGDAAFCCFCRDFPCALLKQLDKRYRANYGMSMMENLESIASHGIEAFLEKEMIKWTCVTCGSRLCVHRETCQKCGEVNGHYPGTA